MNEKRSNLIQQGDYLLKKISEKMDKERELQEKYVQIAESDSGQYDWQQKEQNRKERNQLEWGMQAYYSLFLINVFFLQQGSSYSMNIGKREIFVRNPKDRKIYRNEIQSMNSALEHHRDAICHPENNQLKRSNPKLRDIFNSGWSERRGGEISEIEKKQWDEEMDQLEFIIFSTGFGSVKKSISVGGSNLLMDEIQKYWEGLKLANGSN